MILIGKKRYYKTHFSIMLFIKMTNIGCPNYLGILELYTYIYSEYNICVKVPVKVITVHYVKSFPSLLFGNSKRHHVSLIVSPEVNKHTF